MTRVIVAGAAGRMGQRVIHMVQAHPGLQLAGAFEAAGSAALGKDAGAISGLGETGVVITAGLESVIDRGGELIGFTFHTATLAFARATGEFGSVIFIAGNIPMVSEITPLLIISKLEQYDYAGASAIAVLMLGISFAMLLTINLIQWWASRRPGLAR